MRLSVIGGENFLHKCPAVTRSEAESIPVYFYFYQLIFERSFQLQQVQGAKKAAMVTRKVSNSNEVFKESKRIGRSPVWTRSDAKRPKWLCHKNQKNVEHQLDLRKPPNERALNYLNSEGRTLEIDDEAIDLNCLKDPEGMLGKDACFSEKNQAAVSGNSQLFYRDSRARSKWGLFR